MRDGRRCMYAGVLKIPEGKSGRFEVNQVHARAGTKMRSGTLRTALYGQESETLVFDEPTVWHELSEKGSVWMTDYPIEQRQMDDLIARASGRVLVGGLGLGYAVVALARRPRVREIVVVERSRDVANLVWAATRKRVREIGRKVPMRLVVDDLFKYLKQRQARRNGQPEFTWGLFDIWQGDGEATFHHTVIPLRKLAHGVVRTLVNWNEDVMRGQLCMGLDTKVEILTLPNTKRKQMEGMFPTLEMLTSNQKSIYHQWAVPFWRWFKYHQERGPVDRELVKFVMLHYVAGYGRPERKHVLSGLLRERTNVVDLTRLSAARS